MRTIRDIQVFQDVPILVRAALNVPIANGQVTNAYRLERAAPTIRFLAERGAKVILLSHLGELGTETLAPVAEALGKLLPRVSFFGETVGEGARAAVRDLPSGNILVLENLRRNAGEKNNDKAFARELAALGDIFVEDSFDTCHRMHASIVSVPEFLPSYAGLLLEEEVRELSQALAPEHPALAVVGGAKFSTKEGVLTALLANYDHVFVGGALADDFLKAAGHGVGKSLVSDGDTSDITALLANPKLVLPVDSLVATEAALAASANEPATRVASVQDTHPDDVIVDHGPGTAALLTQLALGAKSILWNGPLGLYEKGCTNSTNALARAIAESGAHSIVGGGDTIAAIEELGLLPRFSFVSSGGGAMLEFLAKGTLPGIDALTAHPTA